jgi:hypothetical protein
LMAEATADAGNAQRAAPVNGTPGYLGHRGRMGASV